MNLQEQFEEVSKLRIEAFQQGDFALARLAIQKTKQLLIEMEKSEPIWKLDKLRHCPFSYGGPKVVYKISITINGKTYEAPNCLMDLISK